MPIDYVLLGQRIAFYRARASLSQDQLADVLHVYKNHISKIEQGKARPSSDLLLDIANALGVSVDDLISDNKQHSPSVAQLQQLLDGCSPTEEAIIIRNAENLKKILDDLDIK